MATALVEDRAELARVMRRTLTADVERVARDAARDYMREVAAAELQRRETTEVAHYTTPTTQPERTD